MKSILFIIAGLLLFGCKKETIREQRNESAHRVWVAKEYRTQKDEIYYYINSSEFD